MNRLLRVVLVVLVGLVVAPGVTPAAAQPLPASTYQDLHWRMIGPFRGGRTRAVAGIPSQPNVFYVGQVNGGVWKTDDSGRTWTPIFDAQPTQSIGDIAIDPKNPDVIYVASGEGLRRPDLSIGDGIYKSRDGGKTWTHLGLRDGQAIPAIRVDPANPDRLFAAVLGHPYGPNTERGIYRSTDGGETWEKVLYGDEDTGGCDVEIDPSDPSVVYACLWESRQAPWEDGNEYGGTRGGLYKSTDGGSTWRKLTKGLPDDTVQVNLAIAPSRPSRLYASVSTTQPGEYATGKGLGLYRSDDAGESWVRITEDPRPSMRIGGGDLAVPVVDPTNPDVVYGCSIVAVKSEDGGRTWQSWRGAPGGDDYQNMWINPEHPSIILLASDQGAIVTQNGGRTWSSWYNQPTAQLYHVIADDAFPYRVCSGQQESGSVCIASRGNDGEISFREWHPVGVIEYGYAAPDPLDPNLVYGAGRNQVSRFHWDTGQVQDVTPIPVRDGRYRTERTEPIAFSPVDRHALYYAANVLFKTTDGGESWQIVSPDLARPSPGIPASVGELAAKDPKAGKQRGAIYSLALSFLSRDTIWAGTDDGYVWITRDGGKNWTNVTPPGLPAWSKVTQISATPFDDDTAYVSVSRFRTDDLAPLIFRTHDGGGTWQRVTTGLPADEPVNTVRADPVRKGLLFAGTERSVFVSFDDGGHWQSLQLDLPKTSMRDLWIKDDDLIVATHGRSFWVLDDITPLRQLSQETARAAVHLFQPAAAYRVRRSTYSDTPYPPDEPMAANPPNGAVIDYVLGHPAEGPVGLEILDADGEVVRRYRSDDPPRVSEQELRRQLIPPYWVRPSHNPGTSAGMHRFVWDLRYPAPKSTAHGYPISAVPHDTPRGPFGVLALPGRYTVRLTVDGETATAPLTVKLDPRVRVAEGALRQQFELASRLSGLMSDGSEAVLQAESVKSQLDALAGRAKGSLARAVASLQAAVGKVLEGGGSADTASSTPAMRALVGTVSSLYGSVEQADAAPTAAQVSASDAVAGQLPQRLGEWRSIRDREVPALNRKLKAARLPLIDPDAPLPQAVPGVDRDQG